MTARSGMILAMAIDSSSMRRSASLGAALADLDDVEGACKPTLRPASAGALAVALGQLALRTLLQAADGGDHDPHAPRSAGALSRLEAV